MSDVKRIGKYEIIERIATGGFGVVYKGRDPFIKRLVAVKTCAVDNEDLRKRFFREAEIAGNLHHPNVTIVHDFGIEGDRAFLVQEYLPGEDLVQKINRRDRLSVDEKLDTLVQVAQGLAYAHSKDVIHRDVKPGNIRILENGQVKIMDFGIAKLTTSRTQLTQKGMAVGTVGYLSPEQLREGKVNRQTDIFSFGVVSYEFLTYQRPFKAKVLSDLFSQILKEDPEPVASLWPACPPTLAQLVERCLQKSPDERYDSFEEIVSELRSIRDQLGKPRPAEDLQGTLAVSARRLPPQETPPAGATESGGETEATLSEEGDSALSPDTRPVPLPPDLDSEDRPEPSAADTPDQEAATRKTQSRPPSPAPPPVEAPRPPSPAPPAPQATKGAAPPTPPIPQRPAAVPPAQPPAKPPAKPLEETAELQDEAKRIAGLIAEGRFDSAKEELESTIQRRQAPALTPPTEKAAAKAPRAEVDPDPAQKPRQEKRGLKETLLRSLAPLLEKTSSSPWLLIGGLAAAGLAVIIVSLVLFGGKDEQPEVEPPPVAPTIVEEEPTAEAGQRGVLLLLSDPWGQVVTITNSTGTVVSPGPEPHTPWIQNVLPGRYSITLARPQTGEIRTCIVDVAPGGQGLCQVSFEALDSSTYFQESRWWR